MLGAEVISADAINAKHGLPFGAEGLPESVWAETLRHQLLQLHEHGQAGRSAVVDDTLCYRWLRDRFRKEAIAAGLRPVLLVLAPPRQTLLSRHARLSESGQRPVLSLPRFIRHLESFEWPTTDEGAIDISTADQLHAWLGGHVGAF
jgi:predicted kinase